MSRRSWVLLVSTSALAVIGPALTPVSTNAAPASSEATATSMSWGPVRRLAPNPEGESLAVDASNTVTVAWANRRAPQGIVVQRRSLGGTWGDRVVIGHGSWPVVATDARGTVTVAWLTGRQGYTSGVAVATRGPGGHWSEPRHLTRDVRIPTTESPYGAARLVMAVNARGATAVAWAWGSERRQHPWRIMSAYRPSGGSFGPSVAVTRANGSNWPQVGIAGRGNVTLLFERWLPHQTLALFSARRVVGTGWTGVTRVVHEGFGESLASDAQGRAVVVYTPNFNRVMAVHSSAHGTWSRPRALSPEGVRIESYALAMNARGTAVVALGRAAGIDVLRRPVSGPWSTPVSVNAGGEPTAMVLVAINAAGDTFVGWGEYALLGAYRAPGTPWNSPMVVSPDAGVEVLETMHAVVSPGGDVTVLWKQEDLPLKVRTMTVSPGPLTRRHARPTHSWNSSSR